jgi:hypothetical protein
LVVQAVDFSVAPKPKRLFGALSSTLGKKSADGVADNAGAGDTTALAELVERTDIRLGKINQGPHEDLHMISISYII